ncbi:MAG: nucleotidyltransferase domain-containing protein [Thiohalorhabdaceae bacterium]
MRLSPDEQSRIKELAQRHFGRNAEVRVFGSRLEDQGRGGNIDLYIETDLVGQAALEAELAFQRAIQGALGKQRPDLTVHPRDDPLSPFEAHAREQGIPL